MTQIIVIPAQAGIQHAGIVLGCEVGTTPGSWIPAFAGMTEESTS